MKIIAAIAFALWASAVGAQMPESDVYVLGEIHDNPVHHLVQADVTRHIKPAALVFEMLTALQADSITAQDRADLTTFGDKLGWESSGWPPFSEYAPIFAAAPDARIYGGALGLQDVTTAYDLGAGSVFADDAAAYGLDHPLSAADQAARQAEQATEHCDALPAHVLPGMVEVQRARDAMMARQIVQAMLDTGGPVVVITGRGHARRDTGIPAVLRVALPRLKVFSLGLTEDPLPPDAPFDAVRMTGPGPERPDPCLAFQ